MLEISAFFRSLCSDYGRRFFLYISITYFLLKGVTAQLITSGQMPYYRTLGVSSRDFQLLSVLTVLPASMKPLYALLSDKYPFCGYRRRPYIIIAGLICGLGVLVLSVSTMIPGQTPIGTVHAATVFFFSAWLYVYLSDLMCEAKYAELMRTRAKNDGRIVIWVWMCIIVGQFVGSGLVAKVIDPGTNQSQGLMIKLILMLTCAMAVILTILTMMPGFMPDGPHSENSDNAQFEAATIKSSKRMVLLARVQCIVNFLLALLITCDANMRIQFIFVIVSSTILLAMSFFCLTKEVAQCNLYVFLVLLLFVDVNGQLDYWYTADSTCVPNGTQFGYRYYQTLAPMVGLASGCCALLVYQNSMSTWTLQGVFCITLLARWSASSIDVILINRWNLIFHVPDIFAHLLGKAFLGSFVCWLEYAPMWKLTAQLCPKDSEALMFSILATYQNLGESLSGILGSTFADLFNVQLSSSGQCHTRDLWKLIVACHLVAPLLCVPLIKACVPQGRRGDGSQIVQDPPHHLSNISLMNETMPN